MGRQHPSRQLGLLCRTSPHAGLLRRGGERVYWAGQIQPAAKDASALRAAPRKGRRMKTFNGLGSANLVQTTASCAQHGDSFMLAGSLAWGASWIRPEYVLSGYRP